MKRLISYFIILLASIWLGLKIHASPGYVLISYQHISIETTLWVAILAILVLLLLLYIGSKIIASFNRLSGSLQRWTLQRHVRKARRYTSRGLCELAEGNWEGAEKYLVRGAHYNETPLINYLAAARAAQGQQAFERRDNYLRQAHNSTKGAEEVAIGLTQAQLQLASKQLERALATLRHLNQIVPHHVYVLKLLQLVYLELQDWEDLKTLIPDLRKYQVLDSIELHKLEQTVYSALLAKAANTTQPERLDEVWEDIPRQLQKDPELLFQYTNYLINCGRSADAEVLLRDALKKSWSELLVKQYGIAEGDDTAKQLAAAESWLKTHHHDPTLLLSLGQICARNRLWGKAREYLEASIKLAPRVVAYQALGEVLEELGDQQAAYNCYRTGLQIA